jgi:hypothetical protein
MKTELRQFFFEAVQENFSWLLAKGRFQAPYIDVNQEISWLTTVVYLGENLALQLVLDERDEDVGCFVAKVVNGRPADAWKYDNHGNMVRGYLTTLLQRHATEDILSMFTRVPGKPLKERIPITLGDYALMIQSYGQHLINDDPTFFD